MFKSTFTIVFLIMAFLLSGTQGWTVENMDDRFINPDISTAKNIFIDVKDVSLIDVLKIISKQSGLSFIASQDVADKKITLYLNKIPLNQAIMTILDANGLMYEMQDESNVFVIKAKYKTEKTKITKVYQLKYATVSSSKLNSALTISGSGSGGASSSSDTSKGGGGLEAVLKDSLSPDGKVVEDPRTNSLIITDVPGQFDIIESTIAKLDVPVPQILIEVEMLDVSKSTADQLGVTYGSGGSFTPLIFTGGSKAVNYPFSTSHAGAGSSSGSSSSSSSSSSSGTTSAYTAGSFNAAGLTAELNFLTTNTDARTLARPRILTLNNQTAQIEISTDQAISVEPSSTSTSSSSSGSTVSTNTIERYTTGVVLKVTPQANFMTREITMAVSPKVVDVIQSQVVASGSKIFDPETRGSDSMLKLKDGQTMIIGGLLREDNTKTVLKLPILGDIPLIGMAFRSVTRSKGERELIIFLTPHIVDNADQPILKEDSSLSVQKALDIENASDRAQEINNSLNNLDSN